ncbi:hypothetical protein [Kitasatospora sp. NPDC092286]|uniref:hypothetical protein n=1 Tax=Kitasatospora sp. NPDC092286 TaxID=3364087 RepID=UPI0038002D49
MDEGGEPACWLDRVCEECGRLRERPGPGRCEHCGAGAEPPTGRKDHKNPDEQDDQKS